jgi:hypothetical protein
MNGSALARSRTGTHISAGSSLGNSAFSNTGVNNIAFASAHLGSNTMVGHSAFFTGSKFGRPFSGSGFNRGFRRGLFNDHDFDDFRFQRGFFNDHDFDDFGFRCFGCGFGFGFGPGFGFGFGWGWGGWWNPWWWDPWWWGPNSLRLRL